MALNLRCLLPLSRVLPFQQGHRHFHRWLAPTLRALKNKRDRIGPDPPSKRSTFIEWNYESELYAFGKRLNETWEPNLLKKALTEYSYIVDEEKRQRALGIENPHLEIDDNREMVARGRALIESYVEEYLRLILPKLPEIHVSSIRNMLLSEETLAKITKHIGADDLILTPENPVTDSTLARVFASLTDALATSSGEDSAGCFIRDFVLTQLAGKDITPFCTPEDPWGTLEDILRTEGQNPPEPRLIGEAGAGTILANYQVGIYVDRKLIGKGFGETVDVAKTMAALNALWKRWGVTQERRPFSFQLNLTTQTPSHQISA